MERADSTLCKHIVAVTICAHQIDIFQQVVFRIDIAASVIYEQYLELHILMQQIDFIHYHSFQTPNRGQLRLLCLHT